MIRIFSWLCFLELFLVGLRIPKCSLGIELSFDTCKGNTPIPILLFLQPNKNFKLQFTLFSVGLISFSLLYKFHLDMLFLPSEGPFLSLLGVSSHFLTGDHENLCLAMFYFQSYFYSIFFFLFRAYDISFVWILN